MTGATFASSFAVLVFFIICFIDFQSPHVAARRDVCNSSSSCGHILNIQFPFHLKNDPNNYCTKFPEYQLDCENNRTVMNLQFWNLGRNDNRNYFVDEIIYHKRRIRIVDPGLQRGNCSSPPRYSNFSGYKLESLVFELESSENGIIFVGCSSPVKNDTDYISTSPCLNGTSSLPYSYVLLEKTVSDLHPNCNVVGSSPTPPAMGILNHTYQEIHQALLSGFYLGWVDPYVEHKECPRAFHSSHCFFKLLASTLFQLMLAIFNPGRLIVAGYIMIGRTSIGILGLLAFLIYKLHRRHLSMDDRIEEFLTNYRNYTPMRYLYSLMTSEGEEILNAQTTLNERLYPLTKTREDAFPFISC